MYSLIKNELYKIFHKKGIYIVLIITALFSLLTNWIYSTDLMDSSQIEENYELEKYFVEVMETEKNTDDEDYLYSKIYVSTYEYANNFGKDSWQKYVLLKNSNYNSILNELMTKIVSYELKKENDKDVYEDAKKELGELTEKFKGIKWTDVLEEEIEETKEMLENNEERDEFSLARLEALNLRKENNIIYKDDCFNEYLENFMFARETELSYFGKDALKESEIIIRDEAIKEANIYRHKIENKIEEIPTASNNYILGNFYNEYFIMIIVMIVLVSGSIVSDEFSKGTIKLLLVKPFSRTKILLSKYITTLIMMIFGIICCLIIQMLIGGLFFGYSDINIPNIFYNLNEMKVVSVPVLEYFTLNTISLLPQFILLSTLCFSLSTILSSTALANTLTIIGSFGSDIINALALSYDIEYLKYFVTLNWDFSCYLFGGNSPYIGVTLPFSIVICLIYLIIMLVVTFIIFNKKNIKNI